MNDFYVYALYRDVEMSTPFYIGKGRHRRASQHESSWYRKNDKNKHKVHCVEKCLRLYGYVPKAKISDNLTELEAFALEVTLIAQWGRMDKKTGCLVNATDGGEGPSGRILSEESLAKMRAAHKGYVTTEATKLLISLATRGKKVSEETRKKMSAWQIGKKYSEETKQKIREKRIGKKLTPEHIVLATKNRGLTPAMLEGLRLGREKRLEQLKQRKLKNGL